MEVNADTVQTLLTGATGGVPITGLLYIAIKSLKKSFDTFNAKVSTFGNQVAAFGVKVESFEQKVDTFNGEIKALTTRLIKLETVFESSHQGEMSDLKIRMEKVETYISRGKNDNREDIRAGGERVKILRKFNFRRGLRYERRRNPGDDLPPADPA